MRSARGFTAAALFAGITACQQAETPEQARARMEQETAAFQQYLASVATRWEGWFSAGQADSIANIYMEQGREMPPNAPAVVGREAIRAMTAQNLGMGRWTIDITPEAAMASGPLGVDRGSYVATFTPGPNMPAGVMIPPADTGKYLAHWHMVDGNWLVAELIYNSNVALPQPPQP